MPTPKIAAKEPIPIEIEAGKNYAWCSCGESTNQPWCDGSHKGTEYTPLVFQAKESKTAYMCQCKHTKNPGLCDGSHKSI